MWVCASVWGVFASLILSACDRKLTVGAIYQCTAHMSRCWEIFGLCLSCVAALTDSVRVFIYLFIYLFLYTYDMMLITVPCSGYGNGIGWKWEWSGGGGNGNSLWSGKVRRLCWRVCLPAVNSGKTAKKAARQKQNSNNNNSTEKTTTTTLAAAETPCSHAPYPMGKFGFLSLFFRIFDFVSHLFSLRIENLCKYFLIYWLFHPGRGMEVCQLSWVPA